jgi:sulfur-oxidizing protein SoxX
MNTDVLVLILCGSMAGCAVQGSTLDGIEKPFAAAGDAQRGREVFVSREGGHCVLCHTAPGVAVAGNFGPAMAGVGSRLTAGQIRLRVADITQVHPQAVMPAFHRTGGLSRVAPAHAGQPILSGQQVEDVVAWLSTLR